MIREVTLLAIFAFLGSCTSSQNLVETGNVAVDIEENTQARVNQITAYHDGEDIVIRGTVRRPGHRTRPLRGHMDLQIETADGTKIEQREVELVRYGKYKKRSRERRFITRVTLKSPRETLVRLQYHEGRHET